MTLVPNNEALQAEVWLKNEDAGFVRQQDSFNFTSATTSLIVLTSVTLRITLNEIVNKND